MGRFEIHKNRLNELIEDGLIEDTQAQIAEVCGTTQQRVSQWVNNNSQLPIDAAIMIGKRYGLDAPFILGITEYPDLTTEAEQSAKRIKMALSEINNALECVHREIDNLEQTLHMY